jgi:hypothetical protein
VTRIETIGDCTLYLGDARDILPTIGKFSLCLTDPPYGIGASTGVGKYGVRKWGGDADLGWDKETPDADLMAMVLASSDQHIIWGGNYFHLPPARCFFVWDKGAGFKGRTFAECEMAWSSLDLNARVLTRDPLAAGDYRGKEHPTQKPVAVMEWCLQAVSAPTSVIDPFMGVGSTGVACVSLSAKFTGIEREQKYHAAACRRIEEAYKQPRLFAEPAPTPTQEALL